MLTKDDIVARFQSAGFGDLAEAICQSGGDSTIRLTNAYTHLGRGVKLVVDDRGDLWINGRRCLWDILDQRPLHVGLTRTGPSETF